MCDGNIDEIHSHAVPVSHEAHSTIAKQRYAERVQAYNMGIIILAIMMADNDDEMVIMCKIYHSFMYASNKN